MGNLVVLKYNEDPVQTAIGFTKITPEMTNNGMILGSPIAGYIVPKFTYHIEETIPPASISSTVYPTYRTKVTFTRKPTFNMPWRDVRDQYFNGTSYTTLYSNIILPDHIAQVKTKNLNGTVASYQINTQFNYMSEEYDRYTSNLSEEEIVPSWTNASLSKADFGLAPGNLPSDIYPNLGGMPYVYTEAPFRNPVTVFPYYNQISISNKVSNNLSDWLKEFHLSDNFLAGYYSNLGIQKTNFLYQQGNVVEEVEQNILNILPWLEDGMPDQTGRMWNIDPVESSLSETTDAYRKTAFKSYMTSLCTDQGRTWQDIMANKNCYNEEYAYEIKKFRDVALGDPYQVFLVRPRNNNTTFNDTQVQYGRTYIYRGIGHYLVMAQTYSYKLYEDTPNQDYWKVNIDVQQKPFLIPANLFQRGVITLQPPPLIPNVSFVTSQDSTKELRIYLSPMKGWVYENFKMVTPDDQEQLDQLEENKNESEEEAGFLFQSFPEPGNYEIFKMLSPPRKITDFSDKKITDVNMGTGDENAIFIDSVLPNTKYYYLFRKINTHGLVSNPTAIYEVELLMDADDSRVIVSDYELPIPKTSEKTHKFKSLFQIEPALEQVIFDQQQEGLFDRDTYVGSLDHVKLGIASKSVWTKKFKFRFKSTTSGKIIDYNVKFKLTRDKTEEDF